MERVLELRDDPGVPLGASGDPFAGLSPEAARELLEAVEAPGGVAVPVVRQLTGYSCGPAALLACLRYWRVWEGPEAGLYARLKTTRTVGTEMRELEELARAFTLEADLEELSTDDLRELVGDGATVILGVQAWGNPSSKAGDSGHYVVLVAIDNEDRDGNAYFMDPAIGGYGFIPLAELIDGAWAINSEGQLRRFLGVVIRGARPLPEPLAIGQPRRVPTPFTTDGAVDEGKAIGTANLSGEVAQRDSALRYRWPGSVKFHVRQASTNITKKLETIAEEAILEVGMAMNAWLAGQIPYTEVQNVTTFAWKKAYERVREVGRVASGIERLHDNPAVLAEEEVWFRSAVREELGYWHVFLEEIKAGGVTEARLRQRFNAYVDALRFMYEAARVYALPDTVLLYWMGPKPTDPREAGRICEGCAYMMELSPFTKAKLPAVPRDGSTACLTNCRHKIVVRTGRDRDVSERTRALPSRAAMVGELKRRKDERHGTHRQAHASRLARKARREGRHHVHNPFRRDPLPPRRS